MQGLVGLINFQYSERNYGAVLQAYALEKVVRELGFNVEHINFKPQEKISLLIRLRVSLGNIIKRSGMGRLFGLPDYIYNVETFEDFRCRHIKRQGKVYKNELELYEISDRYTAVIVGSDQVWRPEYTLNNPMAFFLEFCGENTKRISYAASFGKDEWDINYNHLTSKITSNLQKFKSISVREKSGIKICRDVFGIQAKHVLDPTLLAGESAFTGFFLGEDNTLSNKKVVYYILDKPNNFESKLSEICKKLDYTVENIFYKKFKKGFAYNSVPDWLNEIKSSSVVLTDSFHCICFAILFKKEFVYIANHARGMARVESLLDSLDIKGRINCSVSEAFNKIANEPIDYKMVDEKLKRLRCDSMMYLKDSLE